MKKRSSIFLALAIILMTSMACSVGGAAVSTEVVKEPTPGSEQTSPAATTVPSQEAGGNDPSAGPETIDLTNSALYIHPNAPAYTFATTTKYTGVDKAGVAKEVSEIGSAGSKLSLKPHNAFYFRWEGYVDSPGTTGSVNILSSDTVILGDQMTSAQMVSVNGETPKLVCNTGLASEVQGPSLLESMPKDFKNGSPGRRRAWKVELNSMDLLPTNMNYPAKIWVAGMGWSAHLFM